MSSSLTRASVLFLCALALAFAGCRAKPAYRVGDYLSPIGNSDPNLIIKVRAVNSDSYWVEESPLGPAQVNYVTRKRTEIDGRYVRVDPSDFDRTKNPPKPSTTPLPSSPTATPTSTPTATVPTATPQPTVVAAHALDLAKLSEPAQPSIVVVSVFDSSGKLLRSGTGFFVSDDGRVATTWQTIENGLNAVVKQSDGTIHNVTGVLAGSTALDLAILKVDVSRAKSLELKKNSLPESGTHLAVIGSALNREQGAPREAAVSTRRTDVHGDSLELDTNVPRVSAGSPVLNEEEDVVGIVTSNQKADTTNSVRPASAIVSMLSSILPASVPAWPAKANASGLLVTKPKPTPTPHEPRLLFTPSPSYPFWAQFSQGAVSGRYAIQFGADGNVVGVQVLQSMHEARLDSAVIEGLRRWRSEPGRAWQKTVPVTFSRERR